TTFSAPERKMSDWVRSSGRMSFSPAMRLASSAVGATVCGGAGAASGAAGCGTGVACGCGGGGLGGGALGGGGTGAAGAMSSLRPDDVVFAGGGSMLLAAATARLGG